MKNDVLAHLHDAIQAARAILEFVKGHTLDDYSSDELLHSAVERKFEVMGEALNRIKRDAPDVLAQIRDHRDIISFRNILVHGYDSIDNRIVWSVITDNLKNLIEDVDKLLK